MHLPRVSRSRLLTMALVVLAVALLVGCSALGGDQNTLSPEGEVADKQRDILFIALWPAIVIMFGVFLALIYILIRFRHREGEPPPKQLHGNPRLEIAWTIAPAALLIGIAVPVIAGVVELSREPSEDALHVRVIARQWSWEFQYLDEEFADAEGEPLSVSTTAGGQLHIPVGREIGVDLESPDVIHSFWVPKLAGKLDVIPGRTNTMWFNATEAGTYPGQCAEFCGIGHPAMRFDVVAQPEGEFDAWVEEQIAARDEQASGG